MLPRFTACAVVGISLTLGCARTHGAQGTPRSPEETLEALREARAAHRPIDEITDTLAWSQAVLLAGSIRMRELSGVSAMTDEGWQVALGELESTATPERALARADRWLRAGRCVRVSAAPVPESIARLPRSDPSWTPQVRSLRQALDPRLASAHAGIYRCGDGPNFRAVFFREHADPTVASLEDAPTQQ